MNFRKRRKRLIVLLIFILIIGLAALLGVSKYAFQKACLRKETKWPVLWGADDETLAEAYAIKNEANEEIAITASDGTKLVGHYYERKKNAPVIIFFHGLWSNCYANGVPIYKITQSREWNLLLVSLRAHNESGGGVSTLGTLERYDCRDWANWVAAELGDQSPIFLMGLSAGGAMALMSSDLELPESVCGIIDDAGYTSPLEMIKVNSQKKLHQEIWMNLFAQLVNAGTRIWGGFNLEAANACVAVSRTNVPVLIIHGEADTRAPVSMAYRIYNSCQSEKRLYIVPGAEHTDCYKANPEEYERVVSAFIEEHIPQ